MLQSLRRISSSRCAHDTCWEVRMLAANLRLRSYTVTGLLRLSQTVGLAIDCGGEQ